MDISSSIFESKNPLRIYAPNEHRITTGEISRGANKVMAGLISAGFQAFLVGGGVRDILLKRDPTDFDIVTNATPAQISSIFRSSRLIGRRFKLVHVRENSELIEVATFRKSPEPSPGAGKTGIIFRDNDFGRIEDDVVRRDYTLNALYLDYATFNIFDFVGGLQDLNNGVLRLIGDPEARFGEDPVRVLRAVRFSESLNFKIAGFTDTQLKKYGAQLRHIPPARLFVEMDKLFLRGVATRNFCRLRELGLLSHLLPFEECCQNPQSNPVREVFLESALSSTDTRVMDGGSVTLGFLIAVFLWFPLKIQIEKLSKFENVPAKDLVSAEEFILLTQLKKVAIPRRITKSVREIWALQRIFAKPSKRKADRIIRHPRLRAAYNFFCLRVEAGEIPNGPIRWWSAFFRKSKKSGKLPFSSSLSYRLHRSRQ